MNPTRFLILVCTISLIADAGTIGFTYSVHAEQFLPKGINEDQIIICVNNSDGTENNGLICHIGNMEKIDWYQDLSDGSFFNQSDSFDMEVLP